MKFQWYIIDLDDGSVTGCNDVEQLDSLIESVDHVILSAQHGSYFQGSRDQNEVEEHDFDDEEDEDDDEEDEEDEDGSADEDSLDED